eukprot:gene12620-gene10252
MTWLPISLKNAVKCDKWYGAESFNYRIFERKRRMGEALLGHPRACHILSVERK